MKELYQAELKGNQVYFVREKNNTLGCVFQTLVEAKCFQAGDNKIPFGITVNNEVMTMGTSVGWLKNIKLLTE